MSLDYAQTPLDADLKGGRALIEASAGSGKTHAITTLVARLVVEKNQPIDSILVVTFTKAATAELRKRIRGTLKAIQDANGTLAKGGNDQAGDLLAKWGRSEELDSEKIKFRIDTALLEIDRANILTIHGFCQRALAEFAFETEFPFGFEVGGKDAGIVENVVRDIWQRRFRDSSPLFARYLSGKQFLPAHLANWFASVRAKLFGDIKGDAAPDSTPEAAEEACRAVLESVLAIWRGHCGEYRRIVEESGAFDGRRYRQATIANNLAVFERVAAAGDLPGEIGGLASSVRFLGAENAADKSRPGCDLPDNPMFAAFDELAEACETLLANFEAWFRHFRHQLILEAGAEIRGVIRKERRLGYDDLLIEMRDALGRENTGPRLAESVRRRFPIALIDEFQDTDATQERIFSAVYRNFGGHSTEKESEQPDREGALYIVGDPKQSIYEFRGADIFAYLSAQRESHSRLLLDRNWRSAPQLVAAVNAIFDVPLAFTIPEIAFTPARPARDSADRLEIEGEAGPPFSFWLPEDQKNNDAANTLAAGETARDIVRLLNLARAGKARIGNRPLKASDIAVLVSTRDQGRQIAAALRARGGKCVEVDDSSVFGTREAGQLRRLLFALANPGRPDLPRAALADDLFGLDNAELLAATGNDESWNEWSGRFGVWRELWLTRGVGAMLRKIIDVGAGNLLRRADGPRRLTNLYHLTELLQEAETGNRFSPAGLLAWLDRGLEGRAEGGEGREDAFTLRLDSDEDLVRILTIHKSKGLEFPLVYVPFAWYGREKRGNSGSSISYHSRDGGRFPAVLDLAPGGEAGERRMLEEFGESVRRLYVALTRARERCVVIWTRAGRANKELPPLAWLVHRSTLHHEKLRAAVRGDAPDAIAAVPDVVAEAHDDLRTSFRDKSRADFRADVEVLAAKCPRGIEIRELGAVESVTTGAVEEETELECREFGRPTRRIRQMTSFTALTADHAAAAAAHRLVETGAPDHDEIEGDAEVDAKSDETETRSEPMEHNAFNFPRGIHVGSCLHKIFEILDAHPDTTVDQVCAEQLARAGIEAKWRDAAQVMVENTLAARLREPGQNGFRLADIDGRRRLTELEFCFPVEGLRTAAMTQLLANHGYPILLAEPHKKTSKTWDTHAAESWDTHFKSRDTHSIDGYLRGFIDLAFEHEGRWYVLDYKSNWLGNRADDYLPERLGHAMREHRYQLQYLIYLLALHRYLRTRLPGYDYERHIGGAFYLFLRGMDPAAGMARGVWFDRPGKKCIEALDEFMAGGGS